MFASGTHHGLPWKGSGAELNNVADIDVRYEDVGLYYGLSVPVVARYLKTTLTSA